MLPNYICEDRICSDNSVEKIWLNWNILHVGSKKAPFCLSKAKKSTRWKRKTKDTEHTQWKFDLNWIPHPASFLDPPPLLLPPLSDPFCWSLMMTSPSPAAAAADWPTVCPWSLPDEEPAVPSSEPVSWPRGLASLWENETMSSKEKEKRDGCFLPAR